MSLLSIPNHPNLPNVIINHLFSAIVSHRELIITLFKLSYIILLVIAFILGRQIMLQGLDAYDHFYEGAQLLGEAGAIVYITTLVPGIARRFRIQHKLIALLMVFRRYIGLLTFFLIFAHFWLMRGALLLREGLPSFFPENEIVGIIAFSLLFLLAVTSNDWSTKRLGIWWNHIHSLTYITAFIIFLHVALVVRGTIFLLMAGAVVVLVLSHLYAWQKKSQLKKPVTVSSQ